MEITQVRMEEALDYLSSTDQDYARVRALYEGLSEQRKVVKSQAFLHSGASSAAAREQEAYNSMAYVQHLQKMEMAHVEMLTLQAKRSTECIIIDCWRSLNAARNKGQIM